MLRHESLWIATAPRPTFPALDRPVTVDVAVLGAGIAGLTTAFLLERAGLRVAVLEAGRVAGATTGHTTAKVSAQHGLIYATVRSKFGLEAARAYGEAQTTALETMEAIVRDHDIACDWERRDAYAYAGSASSLSAVEDEVEAAREAGLPAAYTEETGLPWDVVGAVRFDRQAQFQPYRYCVALAELVDGEDCRVYEGTRALEVEDGSPCVVRTEAGHAVTAESVVVATHLPIVDRGGFFAKCHPEREYVLALALDGPVPEDMYVSVEQPTRSLRRHGDLLVLAGDSHKTGHGGDTREHPRALEEFARERFAVRSVEYGWSTQDHMSVDQLPYIGRLGRRKLFVATGFNKWGMTNGTAAGLVIADQILGRDSPWSGLFDPNRVTPVASARSFVRENADVAKRFVGDRLASRGAPNPDELAPGEGRVVSDGDRRIALARAGDGTLHAVSAQCTHLGCVVAFNQAEQSWDCPCHGSRFALDGNVLEGPAVTALDDLSAEVLPAAAQPANVPEHPV